MSAISRIATLGDSVTWGQGLVAGHKFANLVAGAFGVPPLGNDLLLAHSGAIIGISNPDSTTALDNEVPVPAPMIIDQIGRVPSPATIDLVLMTGGINDIGVATIVNPMTGLDDLRAATEQACYEDMKGLLARALATFTTA